MEKILALILTTTLFISCSSDDDNSDTGNETPNVIGSWILNSVTSENSYDLNGDGQGSNDFILETGCLQNETLVFAEDNTAAAFSTEFLDIFVDIDTGTGELTQIVDCVAESFMTSLTWSIDGNVVTITDAGQNFTAAITGDVLRFVLPGGLPLEVLQGDATVQLNETVTFAYRRL